MRTTFDNKQEFHRLRVLFPTYLEKSEVSCAEASFDVIERKIIRTPDSVYYGRENPTYPNHRFVDVSDGKLGLSIINDGLREYEVKDKDDRYIALTLLRSYEFRQSPVIDRWDVYPEMKLSQALGEHEFRYAIYPHAGTWDEAEVLQESDIFNLRLEVGQAGPHEGELPKEMSFVEVEPTNLSMAALKHCEDNDSLILRLFNPTWKDINGKLKFYRPVKEAYLTNLNEERQKELDVHGNTVAIQIPKKKIFTIELVS